LIARRVPGESSAMGYSPIRIRERSAALEQEPDWEQALHRESTPLRGQAPVAAEPVASGRERYFQELEERRDMSALNPGERSSRFPASWLVAVAPGS
jgi:hypothetical protein